MKVSKGYRTHNIQPCCMRRGAPRHTAPHLDLQGARHRVRGGMEGEDERVALGVALCGAQQRRQG